MSKNSPSISPSNTFTGDHLLRNNLSRLSNGTTDKSHCTELANLPVDLNIGQPQFTVKAFIGGIVSGAICTVLAMYYSLKTGTIPSLNILGAVLGYLVVKALSKTGLFGALFTPQENAVVQTLSVAVYSVACPAFGLSSGYLGLSRKAWEGTGAEDFEGNRESDIIDIVYWRTICWCLALFPFGLFLAFPLRKYYLLKKKLVFPSGTATAYIIANLHADRNKSMKLIRVLTKWFSLSFVFNLVGWVFDGYGSIPIFGLRAANYGWGLEFDMGTYGIGVIVPLMTNVSMVIGAITIYGITQPLIRNQRDGDFDDAWFDSSQLKSSYLGLYAYSLFSGLAIMIVQGVWSVCVLIYTIITSTIKERREEADHKVPRVVGTHPANDLESVDPSHYGGMSHYDDTIRDPRYQMFEQAYLPWWIGVGGYCLSGAMCIIVLHFLVDTKWYQTLVAILIVPILAISNIEGMGRTDWDVASAYGKIVMFPIGAWNRGTSIIPAVAICHTTISGCSNSAVLMQDFKTGLLLGANAIVMVIAQFAGLLFGCLIGPGVLSMFMSAFDIPIEDQSAFISGYYALVYRTLAVVATGEGFSSLPDKCLWFVVGFASLTLVMNIAELFLPEKVLKWWPDPSTIALGMLVSATVSMEFLIGWILVWVWSLSDPEAAEQQKYYVASGCIAGSGIGAVVICLLALCGINSPIQVSWLEGEENHFGPGRWIMALVTIFVFVFCIFLTGYFWHSNINTEEQDDLITDGPSSFVNRVEEIP